MLAFMGLLIVSTAVGAPGSAARVERGRYLATLCECFACHSPLQKADYEIPQEGMLGAGDVIDEAQRKVAPNLTPDRETGAGTWSDAQLARAIREGVGHDGRRLSLAMPYDYYSVMTDADVAAVIAYLRSLPAVRHALPKWIPTDVAEAPPEPRRPPADPARLAAAVDKGAYLVRLARCGLCHTPRPSGGTWRQRRLDMEFGGGRRFSTIPFYDELDPDPVAPRAGPPPPNESVVTSPNLTADPSGIAFYDADIFIQTLRTGRVAGIRPLSNAMPWRRLGTMTDDDLRAVFAFLRSVPPVRHRVNNADAPTWCPRCGRRHGLGELNRP